jgi:hypothetical protein
MFNNIFLDYHDSKFYSVDTFFYVVVWKCGSALRVAQSWRRAVRIEDIHYSMFIFAYFFWGGIFVFMLIFFNNYCIVWATITLSHYHTKKSVEWRIGRKKYNIYYVYNYILP